jgi:hypothetical protein
MLLICRRSIRRIRCLGIAATQVRLAGSWSVRLAGGGHHVEHIHLEGWLSSAFYVALPETKAPAGWLTLGQPPADLNLDLPPLRTIEPKPGRLVLFPATMWHGTVPFAKGERLTIACDVAPPGLRQRERADYERVRALVAQRRVEQVVDLAFGGVAAVPTRVTPGEDSRPVLTGVISALSPSMST